jgi:hypothetical protein
MDEAEAGGEEERAGCTPNIRPNFHLKIGTRDLNHPISYQCKKY